MADTGISGEGARLVHAWQRAVSHEKGANVALHRAQTDRMNAEVAVAKWLLPSDAQMGEKIGVWCRPEPSVEIDILMQVEVTSIHPLEGRVSIRSRGSK